MAASDAILKSHRLQKHHASTKARQEQLTAEVDSQMMDVLTAYTNVRIDCSLRSLEGLCTDLIIC